LTKLLACGLLKKKNMSGSTSPSMVNAPEE
jgi:hypothetical protein